MKFNFYISCENADEAQRCIKFIDEMTRSREEVARDAGVPTRATLRRDPVADERTDGHFAERENVDPGLTACTRIGSDTKELLLKELPGRGHDMEHLGKKIKRNAEQTGQLVQLLWDRGEIRFDGTEFYLP